MSLLRKLLVQNGENDYIRFEDPTVARICAETWGDGIGLTYQQAKSVKTLGKTFKGNTEITTFDELQYFGIVTLNHEEFKGCTSLSSLILPKTVTIIGNYALNLTKIESISSEYVRSIGVHAFRDCLSLKKVSFQNLNINSSLTSSAYAFFNDTALVECVLGKITVMPNSFFENCTNLVVTEDLTKDCIQYGVKAMAKIKARANLLLNQGVTVIKNGAFAFSENLSISELNLPSLEILEGGSFNYVKIQKIESLGSITSLMPNSNNTGETFGHNKELIYVNQNILNSLTAINDAFAGCTSLNIDVLSLPSLTQCGGNMFSGAQIARVLDLGNITELFGDTQLSTVSRPFGNQTSINEFIIPPNINSIGRYAFLQFKNASKIKCLPEAPPTLATSHNISAVTGNIFVPDASVDSYKAADGWSAKTGQIKPLSEYDT